MANAANLESLSAAMRELQAEVIAVPPFEVKLLEAGHAVHFRCHGPSVDGLRVDVMSRMRGVDAFPRLWERRVVLASGVAVLSLPDLVAAKKTQLDKDWPMLRRLVEADYFAKSITPTHADIRFWLRECRTPALVRELVARHAAEAKAEPRPAVQRALQGGDEAAIAGALREEEDAERAADATYWAPLKRELEELRHRVRNPER
ncbi:MAG: hypothetical protein U0572_03135 [Phycisphaerales bacterium]